MDLVASRCTLQDCLMLYGERVSAPEPATVRAWHQALNAGDVDRLVALSSEDVEVGGPRGATRGAQALREWSAGLASASNRARCSIANKRWSSNKTPSGAHLEPVRSPGSRYPPQSSSFATGRSRALSVIRTWHQRSQQQDSAKRTRFDTPHG